MLARPPHTKHTPKARSCRGSTSLALNIITITLLLFLSKTPALADHRSDLVSQQASHSALPLSLWLERSTSSLYSHQQQHNEPEFSEDPLSAPTASGGSGFDQHHHHESNTDYYYPDSTLPNSATNHEHNSLPDIALSNNFNQFNRLPDKEFLSYDLAEKACRLDRGCQRRDKLNSTYLSHCSRYKFENLLSNEVLMSIMHDSTEGCFKVLGEFIQLDELIEQFDRLFKNLLTRYNCHNGYSVKWSCDDCKKAYKDWLCATNLPYYMNGERIKPCISFCERVEQRCPYLHPITKEQYGGQPVFICRDPNIPFVPEITPDIPYSEPSKCYDLCHLSDNLTELITDSLSKYDYDKCPDKGYIAEEVRSDPLYCRLDVNNQLQPNRSKATGEDHPNDYNYSPAPDFSNETNSPDSNGTLQYKPQQKHSNGQSTPNIQVHNKKLNDLREVLTIYKSQPKTHKFGHHSDHSSLDHHSLLTSVQESHQLAWSPSSSPVY